MRNANHTSIFVCFLACNLLSNVWGQQDQLIAVNDSDTMFLVENVKRVGIGTAAPVYPLEIVNPDNGFLTFGLIDASKLSLILRRNSDTNFEGVGLGFGTSTDPSDVGAAISHQRYGGHSLGKLFFSTKTISGQTIEMNAHMTIDEDGEVGIGTISPGSKLEIQHDGSGINSQLTLIESGASDYARLSFKNKNVTSERWTLAARTSASQDTTLRFFHTGFGDLMTLDVKGFVGIGTVVPETKLHIKNGSDTDIFGGGFITLGDPGGANISMDDNEFMARNNGSNATLHMQAQGGDFKLHDGLPEINEFIVKDNGNVGLGTNNPGRKLSVKDPNHQIEIIDSDNSKTWTISTVNNQNLVIFEDATDARLVIEAGGQVGIGTSTPIKRFEVRDEQDTDFVMRIKNNSNEGTADGLQIALGPDDGACQNNAYIDFRDGNGTFQGAIQGFDCGSSGVSYTSASDGRLKTNVRYLEGALDLVSAIKPRVYEWIQKPKYDEIGFIAQELAEVLPLVVSGEPDSDVDTDPMSVDYGRMTPVLVGAIQELLERVEMLEKHIERMEQSILTSADDRR